jgi:hypothetical protein
VTLSLSHARRRSVPASACATRPYVGVHPPRSSLGLRFSCATRPHAVTWRSARAPNSDWAETTSYSPRLAAFFYSTGQVINCITPLMEFARRGGHGNCSADCQVLISSIHCITPFWLDLADDTAVPCSTSRQGYSRKYSISISILVQLICSYKHVWLLLQQPCMSLLLSRDWVG